MNELREFVAYICGAAFVAVVIIAGASYAVLEGVRYWPDDSPSASAAKKLVELASAEDTREWDERPVWIAPTPKYDYDPSLMIVKPRAERMKEAELRRKQEAAKHLAKQHAEKKAKARQRVAREGIERRLREQGSTYAYQPEQRPALGIFSFFQ